MVSKTCAAESAYGRISGRLLLRMSVPIAAVGALLLAAGTFGAWRVYRLQQRGSDILSGNVASIRTAEELQSTVQEAHYRLKRFASTGNSRHLLSLSHLLPAGQASLSQAEQLAQTDRERELAARMKIGYQTLQAESTRLVHEPPPAAQNQLVRQLADEVIPQEILSYAKSYVKLNEQELARSNKRNEANANQLMFGLLMLGTCGGVAGMLAGYGIARHVSRTIVQLSLPIRDAAGKLERAVGPVAITAEPGFRDLEAVLQTISTRISTVVERLYESERDRLRTEQLAAIGQLAAGLAHELRNPLTSVKTIVQLGREAQEVSPCELEILEQEVERLEQSLQSFLDFARPPQLDKQPTDLGAVAEGVAALVYRRAHQQGVHLEYTPLEHPVAVVVDAAQIRQVVLNLVLNALEAVRRGGTVRLEVEWTPSPATAAWAAAAPPEGRPVEKIPVWGRIRTLDTGPGLPAGLGERVFEPFISTKETGTGLGLSICRRIVEAHGGEIHAADRPQGGAVFTVYLPPIAAQPQGYALPVSL